MAGEKILIVEDNAANMELASDLLEAAGYRVVGAVTAEAGLDRARREMPGLILMDKGLPGMDGLAAVAALRQDPVTCDIPVVMVTAHAMKGDHEIALAAGCAGYITKPIDTRNFAATIAGFLGAASPAPPTSVLPTAHATQTSIDDSAAEPETISHTAPEYSEREYSGADTSQSRKHQILIVDDEAANRDLLEGLVEALDYEAVTASTGREALALLTPEIDLVLLDVMMPGMDGFEVCRNIRRDSENGSVPVVMVTALTDKADRLRAVEAGANDFITKPIDRTELRVRAASQLRMKEAQDEIKRQREELHRRNLEMEADLDLAREIQQAFLPPSDVSFPDGSGQGDGALRLHHRYHPASTLGGDFVHILFLSETEVAVFICDVMGHGVRSALVTAVAHGLVGELLPRDGDPGRFLTALNRDLAAILGRSRTSLFASAFFLVADVARGEARYANAGHPIPLHVRRQAGVVEPLAITESTDANRSCGPALAIFDSFEYATSCCRLNEGDLIMLFTDGLFELQGTTGDYDEQQLAAAVQRRMSLPVSALFDALMDELHQFSGGRPFGDDVCVIGMEVARLHYGV